MDLSLLLFGKKSGVFSDQPGVPFNPGGGRMPTPAPVPGASMGPQVTQAKPLDIRGQANRARQGRTPEQTANLQAVTDSDAAGAGPPARYPDTTMASGQTPIGSVMQQTNSYMQPTASDTLRVHSSTLDRFVDHILFDLKR